MASCYWSPRNQLGLYGYVTNYLHFILKLTSPLKGTRYKRDKEASKKLLLGYRHFPLVTGQCIYIKEI